MSEDIIAAGSPPERPVEQVKSRLTNLEERVGSMDEQFLAFWNHLSAELDSAFNDVWSTLQVMLMVQGALVDSVQALTADPGQPHSAASKAQGIINEAMEAAYGPAEGQTDDGVVPEPAGDQTGDA